MNLLIGSVIVVMVFLASTIMVVSNLMPHIEQSQDMARFDNAKQTMSHIDSVVRELMYEATGAKRSIKVDAGKGNFIISEKENRIKFQTESHIDVYEPGTVFRQGNMIISSGPYVSAYESDIDSDGSTELVLENRAILLAVEKIGNSTNKESFNFSDIITKIVNKREGLELFPKMNILLGGTSYSGSGYTELVRTGDSITTGVIRIVIKSERYYEVLISLGPGQDFLELEVKNIE